VVGLVPTTCTRAVNDIPAAYVNPDTVTGPATSVSTPPADRDNRTVTDPFAFTNTLAAYAFPAPTRRPVTVRYSGPPTGTLLALNTSVTSASVRAGPTNPSSCADALARLNTPPPGLTENCAAVPTVDHVPPTFAAPHPLTTVRPNESDTNGVPTGATGATTCVTDDDAPRSSITVNVTDCNPPAAYVCDADTPAPVPPSPNDHAYDATDPSASEDPDPSNEHDSPAHDDVNAATGGLFDATVVTGTWWVTPSESSSSSVTTSVTA
jgi:hypothetical protein